jgi:hypothetical protein
MKRTAIALALVSASTLGLAQTSHAMSLPAPNALKQAVPSHTTEVQWRRGGGWWGSRIGVGIAAGALTAAALASRPYWGGGYWGGYPGYAYAPAYYDDSYAYAPAYYDESYAYAPGYYDDSYAYAPAYSYAYGGYAPAYSYSYGPAYSYSYGTTYVPRASYAYGRVGPRARYANTLASGVRSTYSSGPKYRAVSSRSTVRVANHPRYR